MRERNNPFTRNGTRSELKSIFGIFFDNADKTTFFFPRVNSLISNFDRDTITYENLNRTDDEFSLYKFSLKFKKNRITIYENKNIVRKTMPSRK